MLLYHGSKHQNLKIIHPSSSTHGKPYVYAVKHIEFAYIFINSLCGDFALFVGLKNNIPYLCERFPYAVEKTYRNVRGSIYTLDESNFKGMMTGWDQEYVSEYDEEVITETKIDNFYDDILSLKQQHRIAIDYYPDRISSIPKDDADLIQKGIEWYKQFGDSVLQQLKEYQSKAVYAAVLKGIR